MNADFDSLASMVAAKKFYPDAVMSFAGSQEKNIRDFFAQSDRKSTRLNSSHITISYAVFCLKKKRTRVP